jgi:hypothetical protein
MAQQLRARDDPGNRTAELVIAKNIRDFGSFPLLDGDRDEWLTLQAGMPLYPALFGRDTLTAGWQAAWVDRGASLDASLTRLGRLQSDRVDPWRDEEPGRIPYQVRRGPLALLDVNPYAAYYADYASPLMFVIALVDLYSWTGDVAIVRRHWDTVRRILDCWVRSRLPRKAQPVPPIYRPEVAADAIVWAAHHGEREVWLGAPVVIAIISERSDTKPADLVRLRFLEADDSVSRQSAAEQVADAARGAGDRS